MKNKGKLRWWLSLNFHPPMRSDNLNDTMKLVRFLAEPVICVPLVTMFGILLMLCANYLINVLSELSELLSGEKNYNGIGEYLGFHNFEDTGTFWLVYGITGLVIFFICAVCLYKIRTGYSEKDINKGQEGKRRWTTIKEIDRQYKDIPMRPSEELSDGSRKTNWFPGKPGFLVSRWRDRVYIDTELKNNLYIGATRSGKGEMYVYSAIDICSRAEKLENRSSMIIFDPKVELYRSPKKVKTLENRGYEVRLLNVENPMLSAGYNPLQIVIDYYKEGEYNQARQAARSFSYMIFHSSDDNGQEAIWKNTSTDLFAALVLANVSDCLDADEELNFERRQVFKEKQENYREIAEEMPEYEWKMKQMWQAVLEDAGDGDPLDAWENTYIPDTEEFIEVHLNEKKINCFSVVTFFKNLCERAGVSEGSLEGEERADSLLEEYFNTRPDYDYAKNLFMTVKASKDKTKASIYTNMQSAVSVFMLPNIASMMTENDISFEDLGYGDKPIAVFWGIPDGDPSNWFIATTYISQAYQCLQKLAKERNGELKRNVRFILDEFGNMPAIENMQSMLTNCLTYGISFDLFVQSYSLLSEKYGSNCEETVVGNCQNRVFIKAGKDDAKEFSEDLGDMTKINKTRTGKQFQADKQVTESVSSVPLMNAQELNDLMEGETVLIRGKRKDEVGAGVRPLPVINERLETLSKFQYIKAYLHVFGKRIIKKDIAFIEDSQEYQSFSQELEKEISDRKRKYGTALYYRYQYMKADFPDPKTINFLDVCDESRIHINFRERINDPTEIAKRVRKYYANRKKNPNVKMNADSTNDIPLKDVQHYAHFYNIMAREYGPDFMEQIGISESEGYGKARKTLAKVQSINGKPFDKAMQNKIINIISDFY